MSPGLVRGDSGRLANEAYLSKSTVSSNQKLSKIKNYKLYKLENSIFGEAKLAMKNYT